MHCLAELRLMLKSSDIAALLGTNTSTIWRWGTGRAEIPTSAIARIIPLGVVCADPRRRRNVQELLAIGGPMRAWHYVLCIYFDGHENEMLTQANSQLASLVEGLMKEKAALATERATMFGENEMLTQANAELTSLVSELEGKHNRLASQANTFLNVLLYALRDCQESLGKAQCRVQELEKEKK